MFNANDSSVVLINSKELYEFRADMLYFFIFKNNDMQEIYRFIQIPIGSDDGELY
jgi:hypothetical protein